MAQRSKLTEKNYPIFKTLFEIGLPMRVIAKAMAINPATAEKYRDKIGKDDFEIAKGTNAAQLRMLELYSSWIAEPADFALLAGGTVKDLLHILWDELRFSEFEIFIMGILATRQIANQPSFTVDVSQNERDFITALYFHFRDKPRPTKEVAQGVLQGILAGLHKGTLVFPDAKTFSRRIDCYTAWTKQFITETKNGTAPIITGAMCTEARKGFACLTEREATVLESSYKMGWWPERISLIENITDSRIREIKHKAFVKLWYEENTKSLIFNLESVPEMITRYQKKILQAEQSLVEQGNALVSLQTDNKTLITKVNFLRTRASLSLEDLKILGEDVPDIKEFQNSSRVKLLTTKVEDLDLRVRSFNCLKAAKINFMFELVEKKPKDFLAYRNFGKKSAVEIEVLLAEKGLSFGMTFPVVERKLFLQLCYDIV